MLKRLSQKALYITIEVICPTTQAIPEDRCFLAIQDQYSVSHLRMLFLMLGAFDESLLLRKLRWFAQNNAPRNHEYKQDLRRIATNA